MCKYCQYVFFIFQLGYIGLVDWFGCQIEDGFG